MKKEKNYNFISGRQKVKARIRETSDNTAAQYKGRICVFNSQEISESLVTVVGGEDVFLGKIKRITKAMENGKELWHIETNMGAYKFEVLEKSPINIINNKEAIEHLSKLLHNACDDIIDNFVADIFIKDSNTNDDKVSTNSGDSKIEDIPIPSFLKRNS